MQPRYDAQAIDGISNGCCNRLIACFSQVVISLLGIGVCSDCKILLFGRAVVETLMNPTCDGTFCLQLLDSVLCSHTPVHFSWYISTDNWP